MSFQTKPNNIHCHRHSVVWLFFLYIIQTSIALATLCQLDKIPLDLIECNSLTMIAIKWLSFSQRYCIQSSICHAKSLGMQFGGKHNKHNICVKMQFIFVLDSGYLSKLYNEKNSFLEYTAYIQKYIIILSQRCNLLYYKYFLTPYNKTVYSPTSI